MATWRSKVPTEVIITDRREKELSDLGFIALCYRKGTDSATFFGSQTANRPREYLTADATANARLSSSLPYLMAASRFAHYIKVMMRDRIGSFMTEEQRLGDAQPLDRPVRAAERRCPAGIKARYPLREARVDVSADPERPGCYRAVVFLRPHFQLEELTVSLRLVANLPAPAAAARRKGVTRDGIHAARAARQGPDQRRDVTLTGFDNMIEVMSYSHGVAQQVLGTTSHTGRTTGRPNFQDMTISKTLDATTPLLNYNCAKASNLGTVKLHLVRQDASVEGDYANAFAYMVYEMDATRHLLGQRRRRRRPAGGDAHPELQQYHVDVQAAAGGAGGRREHRGFLGSGHQHRRVRRRVHSGVGEAACNTGMGLWCPCAPWEEPPLRRGPSRRGSR